MAILMNRQARLCLLNTIVERELVCIYTCQYQVGKDKKDDKITQEKKKELNKV